MSVKSLRSEHAEMTRAALMKAGRKLFAKHGYAGVSAEEIVKQARVTRGALYHHFKDKKELFGEICDEMGAECAKTVEDAAMHTAVEDPWRAFNEGVDAYLDMCVEGDFMRLVILEAPTVEGWEAWREHAETHMLGLIKMGLQMMMDAGVIKKQPVDVLASMFFSVLNEGAMLIGHADDRKKARKEVGGTIHFLLDGLRA
jgi:AcrR family transcriptional regulator